MTTPIIALSDVLDIVNSNGRDRLLLMASVPTTLWSAAAIFRRGWPFWVRAVAMLSPLVLGVFVVYARVGFEGDASAIATVVVVLTGLLFGRRTMALVIVGFLLLALLVGTAMSLGVMPWQRLRVPEMDRPASWVRAIGTGGAFWVIAGFAVTFMVERVERSVRETREALATLQAVAAGVAHDFGNVLGVISVWSMAMFGDGSGDEAHDEPRQEGRKAIKGALQQGQWLTQQFVALTQPEAPYLTRFSLDGPIKRTVETWTSALPPNIQIGIGAPVAPQIEGDENEIQQVVYDLILNARDAMPDGGSIHVTAGLETSPIPIRVVGGSLAAGRWATLSVQHSGPGIDPAIGERTFDLSFTAKGSARGTGLGLATVLRIAKASGGGVTVETQAGRGAAFKLYFPCI